MTSHMATQARPEKLKIWPVDDGGFGIDVRWSGGEGDRRATVVREQLADAGVAARVTPRSSMVAAGSCTSGLCRAPRSRASSTTSSGSRPTNC